MLISCMSSDAMPCVVAGWDTLTAVNNPVSGWAKELGYKTNPG